jgi:hypothetical protein
MKVNERWGPEFIDNRDWRVYNEELVVRGEFYLDMEWVKSWDEELDWMNEGKRGSPFEFPESLIKLQSVWYQWVEYRGIEGITRKLAEHGLVPKYNDYSTINRRVNKLDIDFELPKEGTVNVSSDGSGMKMDNGGSYRERKYGGKRKKYIKVVITADPIKRKLIDCEVSIEGEGDSEPDIALDHIKKLERKGKKVEKFWGDPAFDKRELINHLAENGSEIAIKPRDIGTSDDPESRERKKLVEELESKGYKKWAKDKKYGMRWIGTEGMFSAVKRKFGENVRSTKVENMLKEAKRKFGHMNW